MSILKFKNPDGTWKSVTAIQGEPGKDGAIQYKPGKGINITEDNVIEAEFEDITVDETPVEGSNNPVSSGGVFEALENVNPNIQFTEMPDINTVDVDKVIQYIGETNEQFTKGYWYKISETYTKERATILAGMSYVTDIIPSNHKVECVVDCTSYIYNGHVFGLYDPSHTQHTVNSMNFTLWQNGYWWGTDGTHINGIDNIFKTGTHKIVFNEKGEDGNYHITLNDEIVDTVKCTGDTQLSLFMRGNEANFSGIFYHFKVWDLDTDELLLHLVPYELNGVGALYDLVSNEVKYVNKSMVCAGDNTNAVRQWVQVDTQPTTVSWPEYDCPVVVVSCRMIDVISEPRYITTSEVVGQDILQKLNDLYAKGVSLFVLRVLTPDQQHIGYLDALMSFDGNTIGCNPFELPKYFEKYKYLMPVIDNYMSISSGKVVANSKGYVIRINNWMIDRYYQVAAKSDLASYAQTSAVLLKTNTTSYTPTDNFHPATKKYVDDAIAGIEIPEGGGKSYPIYHTYIAFDLVSPDRVSTYDDSHSSKMCEKFANIFTDMATNGFQIAEILNDAYSMNFKITFRKPLRNNANTVYLLGTKYDFDAKKLSYSYIDVSYTITDGVYTVSLVRVTPYSTSFATTSYVDDAVAGASGGITTETDPTVPDWAKQPSKPTYTASEVGALPASTVIPTVPTNLSAFTDDLGTNPAHSHSQYLTAHQDLSGKQNKVLYGTADPTSDIGVEGDIYVKYV